MKKLLTLLGSVGLIAST
ncbi:lipoprotein, partial [Mycoplasma capricolum]